MDVQTKALWNMITISGLEGDKIGENVRASVVSFLKDELKMENVKNDDVVNAYRAGQKKGKKPRTVTVKCSSNLRFRIFGYTKHL